MRSPGTSEDVPPGFLPAFVVVGYRPACSGRRSTWNGAPVLRKVQIFAVVVVVVGFVGTALASLAFRYFGNGTLHVVTVGGGAVELVVDGLPTRERSREDDHFNFEVSRGHHEVKLTDSTSGTVTAYSVDVANGFSEILLPTRKDQCFLRFDMTDAAYSRQSARRKDQSPPLEDTYPNTGEPITVPTHTYLTFGELPDEITSKQRVYLLRDMPCAFTVDGANPRLLRLALSERADELFTNPDALVNDDQE